MSRRLPKIRRYGEADLDAVVDLMYSTWHSTFPDLQHPDPIEVHRRRFIEELCPRGEVLVAILSDTVVGFLVVFVKDRYLDQIWVDPDHQSAGIGSALLKQARTLSPAGLTLHTLQRNSRAQVFYERHGFLRGETGINRISGYPNVSYHWPGGS